MICNHDLNVSGDDINLWMILFGLLPAPGKVIFYTLYSTWYLVRRRRMP